MDKINFEIVTAERVVYSDDVDVVVAPGTEGQLGILPHHASLMTMLQPGELIVKKGSEEHSIFVSGGFMEVRGNKVVVLADTAERAEEIDISRAEAAKRRAEERMAQLPTDVDLARAQASLLRSMTRLKVAEKVRKRRPQP
ncbi:MAG: F0F1 ATP synthase subunit epsilon [Chloroflexi bacterium RBG_13_52_14]|nr:MAG: F0F1 ATP synthase subunit epsilon [Chloroflexi bacterium RBG_13_52_14]